MSAIKERIMEKNNRIHPLCVLPLLVWIILAVSGCATPVQAAGSPTPPVGITTPTSLPQPTPVPSSTPLPKPVCTVEWAWRDAGLTVTAVDFSRADGLSPGDLVLSIDGRDVEAVIAEIEAGLVGIGNPDLRRIVALETLLYGSDVLVLLVRHGQAPAYYYNLRPDCRF
jgi:hypothetical protein